MMNFYFSIIQPLKRKYTSWALGNLASGLQITYDQNSDRLSATEEIRHTTGVSIAFMSLLTSGDKCLSRAGQRKAVTVSAIVEC